jgi:tellurite resistance protein
MGFLTELASRFERATQNYAGDPTFLLAATSAAANVIAADGTVEDAEVEAALRGMLANKTLKTSYTPAKIDDALTAALIRAKSRAGKMENRRNIESMATKTQTAREDVFLIAADTTDGNSHSLGEPERAALKTIADLLGLDDKKLLG